ncbi:fungal-specific transcription factor domain-containing protein [Ampelomyces quisqualis]|uniref:Fungal-specific transcription factor domain-containing protein n=1 Tax=Ampelomyces quisqualis TaxID=50730 RepID=A0A6A5QBP3_AMPQU|nr:fungal-specific transcription factor domain-containing protein [Ampelomyces quisqualis]
MTESLYNAPKRRKRFHNLDLGTGDSTASHVQIKDPLAEEWLTPEVWGEMFDIYEKHFASDLPFLHRRRFLEPLQNPGTLTAPSIPLQLGLLTLTIRYHAIISRYGGKTSIDVAEEYAQATLESLHRAPNRFPGRASVDRIQALLLVGYHRWTDLKGAEAWHIFGQAGRSALLLRLHKDEAKNGNEDDRGSGDESEQQERFIDREIERRTFWSCLIMDQYTSCIGRPYLFRTEEIETQLPCSDANFHSGLNVKTRLLGESDVEYAKRRQKHQDASRYADKCEWETGKEEAELGLYIQAVLYFAEVMNWSKVERGRRAKGEKNPWEKKGSTFHDLELKLEALQAALPKHLRYTQRNTTARIYSKTSRIYVEIHAAYRLSAIALYREYMAFAPLGQPGPTGPLDKPLLTPRHPKDDPEYWIRQARTCFGAAREFADLLKACKVANCLVDSAIVGFATYIVAWCAAYCFYFPNMDPDKVLGFALPANRASSSEAQPEVWVLLIGILFDSGERYAMHAMECGQLKKLLAHYSTTLAKWRKNGGSPASMDNRQPGGLEIYAATFEEGHKTMGSIDDSHHPKLHRDGLCLSLESDASDQGATASPSMAHKSEGSPATVYTPANQPQDPRRQRSPSEAPTLPSVSEIMQYSSPTDGLQTSPKQYELPQIKESSSTATSPIYDHISGAVMRAPRLLPQHYHTTEVSGASHVMPESQRRRASVQEDLGKERGQMVSDGLLDAGTADMAMFVTGNDDVPPQIYYHDPVPCWLDQLDQFPLTTRYGLPIEEEPSFFAHGHPGSRASP